MCWTITNIPTRKEAVKAMSVEAEKLLSVPSVRKAYEHFLLVAKLTKDKNDEPNR